MILITPCISYKAAVSCLLCYVFPTKIMTSKQFETIYHMIASLVLYEIMDTRNAHAW